MERKLIGVVGVDSGQLMIMDPCYVNSEWQYNGDITGVKFWGEAEKDIIDFMQDKGYEVITRDTGSGFISAHSKEEAESIQRIIYSESKRINKVIVTKIKTSSTYDKICDVTLSEDQAGQLNYRMGHAGLGVAFSSGLGDGVYEVYATYQDIKDWGNRITKVEIELIPDKYFVDE